MLIREVCSTYEFESCINSKHGKYLEQANSIGGDKKEVARNFLNIVLRNDQRVITQDSKYYCVI